MIDDLSKTIKAQLYERINSPLLGSFVLSWATWNYKFIIVLFSAMSVEKTFAYIDQTLYPTWLYASGMLLIGPAITAALIIFVYPYPAKFVYEYARKRQKELKEIQQRIDDETPLTKEEAREIRHAASKQAIELETRLQQKEQEVARLRLENEQLSSVIKKGAPDFVGTDGDGKKQEPINAKYRELTQEITSTQSELLIEIANHGDSTPISTLISGLGGSKITHEYDIDKLIEYGYVRRSTGYVRTTEAGRAYLIEHKLNN
jgi:hypothetical protein